MATNGLGAWAPAYAGGGQVPMSNYGSSGLGGFDPSMFGMGLGSLLGGLFGNPSGDYSDAMQQYQKWMQQAAGAQSPFYNAGTGAIPQYQDWLKKMSDPSAFINSQMNQYQQSPWAKYEQQQAMRTANNMGSATGMTGSTPMMQQAQQNASNISSGDMNQWLGNVLGVNQQYGAGLNNMMGYGQHSADILSQLYQAMAGQMGAGTFGKDAANQNSWINSLMGGAGMIGSFFGL